MSSEKPNFLSQPVVKNIFVYRNGDPYSEARRIVINQKRVCNFETLLKEVTGGIQPPFGAVRNIYTPRAGHKVDCLESLQSGEQYVAAGKERFKKLDYLQIGSRKKRMMQTLPMPAKPLPQNRIIVSARFLKPIKEPCTIFVVANGDILNPAMRLLIHQRMLGQFDRILEMLSEKMGLRVLGGVRSLYTYEGQQVTDGNQLESGQLYVAVGREKFKRLPYSDLLFTKPRGTRRARGMKAYSLPPIYRFSKQSGNSKSMVRCSNSGDGESKASPSSHNGNSKEHLSSIVREISQARLLSFRKRRSGQSLTLGASDNDDLESKADDGNADGKPSQDQQAEEKLDTDNGKATKGNDEPADEKAEAASENTTEEDGSVGKADKETNGEQEVGEEKKGTDEQNDEKEGEAAASNEVGEVKEEVKQEVTEEIKGGEKSEERGSNSEKNIEKENIDTDGGKRGERSSKDHVNDVDTGEEQKETDNSKGPGENQTDNETKANDNGRSSSSNSNQEDKTKEGASKESGEEDTKVNGEVSAEDDGVESEGGDMEEKNSASSKDATVNDAENQDKSKEVKD